ncbi:hypothetical protein [Natronobacterium texcoconense]|uniref:Uncharacterized protein n=1 Tax=Natronobacterium texcoconense TaxID=1095778 RepID=A0A1H1A1J3_NATTX|nr:hypothetical protein [Natronobacterium texcoconense]SDQ33513.1 hypothetical protein SAMN04489842_0524 [Natronobacterium texcoconense]
MGLLDSLRNAARLLESSAASNSRMATDSDSRIAGAYWCDDCSVRIPVSKEELDDERSCPDCGESMRLERHPESGHCAC